MDIITILAVAPIIIGAAILYLLFFWVFPSAGAHTFKDALPNIIGIHFLVLFLAWFIWGFVYMVGKTNNKNENSSMVTNVEKYETNTKIP